MKGAKGMEEIVWLSCRVEVECDPFFRAHYAAAHGPEESEARMEMAGMSRRNSSMS